MTWFGWRAAQPRANMEPFERVIASMADVLHQWEEAYFLPGTYVSADGQASLTPRCTLTKDPSYVLHTLHDVSSEVRTAACDVIGEETWQKSDIRAQIDNTCECGETRLIIRRSVSEGR